MPLFPPQQGPAGFTTFGTGGFSNVINSSSGGSTVMVAGTWYYAPVYVPFTVTLTGIMTASGSGSGTDNWILALWPFAGGTALASSALAGTAAPASNNLKKAFPFTAPLAVAGPGVYIIGLQSNGTTARCLTFSNATEGFITGSTAGVFGTLPSLSPAASYSANVGPLANTY